MKYFLHYDKENNIIGCGTMPTICQTYECREVSKEKYNDYYSLLEKKKEIQKKIEELTNWFDSTYRYKIEKYTRLIALEKLDDDGFSAESKLTKLYEEAEEKRYKIQKLEKIKWLRICNKYLYFFENIILL